jgi:hypothetical protein
MLSGDSLRSHNNYNFSSEVKGEAVTKEGWHQYIVRQRYYCERFEVFTAVTMENAVFWDTETQKPSQETHYVSATETRRLMLVRFEVYTAVNMENAVFWDIKTQFVPHRRHITSSLQSIAS